MEVHEDITEYKTYRTLVNHLLEGLADIEEGRVRNFQEAMKEIREELEI
jgi:predicted transcriptional regulator